MSHGKSSGLEPREGSSNQMTLGLEVSNHNPIKTCRLKVTAPAIISLIVRTVLERKDSFDDIPEEVLNDLIRRFEVENE